MKKAMGDLESRLSQWRERILEREQSGISVCAWCAHHGFTEQQYYYLLLVSCSSSGNEIPAVSTMQNYESRT